MTTRLSVALLMVAFAASPATAQTPLGTEFTYQGQLASGGSPVDGSYDLQFTLHAAPAGESIVAGPICADNIGIVNGLFTVPLDFGPSAFNDDELWLAIGVRADSTVGNCTSGAYTSLSPRQKLTATPYALRALAVDWGGVVGPPTCFPLCLPFSGAISSGVAFGINATSASDVAALSITNAASGAECLDAISNGGGNVVEATMTGSGRAGHFDIANSANTNDAIFSTSNGSGTTISATMSGTGRAGSFNNSLVNNTNPALEVSSAGSPTGDSGTLNCVNNGNGRAAYFENQHSSFYTIRVNNTTGGLAAQFIGNVAVSGNLSASGTKPFRIDHPDDPENKYLLHYAAESPEVINFYTETATLDERGEAVIELPHYFAKINTRPRYQLTAVGAPMPMLHVSEKISAAALATGAKMDPGEAAPLCTFRIAGGAPGGEVSWEVKAVRNDRWLLQRGAPVEVDKQGPERGTYQHPELYGQPPEKGADYDAERDERAVRPALPDAK